MTEVQHLPGGPWTSEEIFNAISSHPLEIKTSYSVLTPTNGASSTVPPPGPPRRRQVQQRVSVRENETKTLYLTQDFSQHFTDPAAAYAAAHDATLQYQHRQHLRSNSSRARSKSGTGPDLTLLPGIPPPASLVTLQISSSTIRLSERSCLPMEGKSVFANGYQSWSTSYAAADETTVFENPNWLYNELTQLALGSDRHIFEYPGQKG
ncbi:hypothetical protein BGX29_008013, partial [Mortierella sp. GBA35]